VKFRRLTVRTENLSQIANDLCAEFDEIEACAKLGVLRDIRERAGYTEWISPALWEHLAWADSHVELANCPKREEWFEVCVRRFRRSLQPPITRFRSSQGANAETVNCETGDGPFSLRIDQLVYQRHWGVEIYSDDPKLDEKIAGRCLASALERLHSDVASVNHWCRDWLLYSRFLQNVSFSEDRVGNRFEQLVLGILNEHAAIASIAPLYDDVRSWTDIRVHKLGELRNIPVQTKFLRKVAQHDEEMRRRLKARETVVVSPVEIARFAEESCSHERNGYEWRDILDLFERKPHSLDDLASEIFWLFATLLEEPRVQHPFDPVQSVPEGIRKAICALVGERAAHLPRSTPQPDAYADDDSSNSTGNYQNGNSIARSPEDPQPQLEM
jgi:hypothetical protein